MLLYLLDLVIAVCAVFKKQIIASGATRRYAPRRWQFDSRRIYVRPRTGPQSAHLWWQAVAKLQAASVPIAWAAARLGHLLPGRDGRIAVSLNAPRTAGA